MKKQKSPKILADALLWISLNLTEFGLTGVAVKDFVEFIKLNLGNTNQSVRSTAVTLIGQIRIFLGPEVRNFVSDLSAPLLAVIDAELNRVSGEDKPEITKVQKVYF